MNYKNFKIFNTQPNTLFTTSTSADDSMSFVFRSYSTDAETYLWDFGDGNTSTEANPNYTYATGGLYTVTLTTTSSDGLVKIRKMIKTLALCTFIKLQKRLKQRLQLLTF